MTNEALAAEIRRVRESRSMTREELAWQCTLLGEPGLTAEVILNIEGRRARGEMRYRPASVWELTVIARALRIAPLLLIYPVGTVQTVAVPGPDTLPPLQAALWFSGEIQELTGNDDPLVQDWGRGAYSLGLDAWADGDEGGQWQWYETPENDAGPLLDIRSAQRRLMQFRTLMPLIKAAMIRSTESKTDAAQDVWSAVLHILGQEADKHWTVLDAHRKAAKRSGVDLFHMEGDEQEYQRLQKRVLGEESS